MSTTRLLHVDDEADIREIVEIALSLDPDFEVRPCGSGAEAIPLAGEWLPFLILLDVMMPAMDGPATLAALRKNEDTSDIPVLFMTARAQSREIDRFMALGAQGVILKPFDPMTLASEVHRHLRNVKRETLRGILRRRGRKDAAALRAYRAHLAESLDAEALEQIKRTAVDIAGAANLAGNADIAMLAGALEKAAAAPFGSATQVAVTAALDRFIVRLETYEQESTAAMA